MAVVWCFYLCSVGLAKAVYKRRALKGFELAFLAS